MTMMSSEVGEIAAAISKAQAEILDAVRDAQNPHLRNRYATLESVLASVRPVMSANGIAVLQQLDSAADRVSVITRLVHSSGQWVGSEISASIRAGKGTTEIQAMGSVITYLRRYSLMALCGIAPEDDDGNSATATVRERKSGKSAADDMRDAAQSAGVPWDDVTAYLASVGKIPQSDDQRRALAGWLRGPGAGKIRERVIARAEQVEHDESFDDKARTDFFGLISDALDGSGADYDGLKRWCKAHKKPKPSAMSQEQRSKLIDWLTKQDGAEQVAEWLSIRAADETREAS